MWLLHFLPDGLLQFIVDCILLAGFVGTILSFFVINKILRLVPGFAKYYHIAQVVSILVLAAGIYLKGGYNTEMAWRERVRDAEEKVKIAEQKAKDANAQIKIEYVDRVQVVKDVQVVVKDRIVQVKEQIDAKCDLDPAVPKLLNQAAAGGVKQ